MMTPRILYVQFADPAAYPPVEHSSRLLAECRWEVFILGVGTLGDLDLQFPDHSRIRLKKMRFVQHGWRQKLQYVVFLFWALYWAWWWKPSWIYASDPLVCPIVWVLRKILGIKVVYHEHDSPTFIRAESRFMKEVLTYREKLGRDCEICVLPERVRMLQFLETTRRKGPTYCVWNCPSIAETAVFDADRDSDQDIREQKLSIYYHGSITSVRLPRQLIIAACRFKGAVRVRIAGYEAPGSIGYVRELLALAAKNGAADTIEALGTIPLRRDLLRSASKAHIGLSLMPKESNDINMQHMVGASNKAFDYMACGLPLLVTDMPEWVATFVEPGYARACDPDDPDSIEAELRWYLDHPDKRCEMARRCNDKIRTAWNYESMFAKVFAQIENG